MDNTEYIRYIPFTGDEPCKSEVGTLCLKDCKMYYYNYYYNIAVMVKCIQVCLIFNQATSLVVIPHVNGHPSMLQPS